MIRYANIIADSIVDGPGIRTTVFLQGCPRHCEGCHNPDTIPSTGGIEIDEREFVELVLETITPLHKGVTFSGGDPLMQPTALLKAIMLIRKRMPKLDIWVYTGYKFEEVKDMYVMPLIDVLVDGPFVLRERDLTLKFRGSFNQRIIDIPRSLQQESVVIKLV